jgi:bacterioferritin
MASNKKVIAALNEALEREMSNVVSYLHYSFMVRGVNRGPLVEFFRSQAQESFVHATKLGEKIVALGGHPSVRIEPIKETKKHKPDEMLREELEREKQEVERYVRTLKLVDDDIALRLMLEDMIKEEQEGVDELTKRIG